jgi:D-3-phosphoglycerate dehydrogenase / 2-oxoglutarate reductase
MPQNLKKVLAPNTMAKSGWDLLAARDDIEAIPYEPIMPAPEFQSLLADAEGIALSVTPFTASDIAASPRMRAVARIGVGYDAVDVPALTERRIPLLVAGTANSVSVAEHALFLIFALAKRSVALDAMVRQGKWVDRFQELPVDLAERTVLVIGFGRIGSRLVKRCVALDMRVLVFDPYVDQKSIAAAGAQAVSDLDAAVAQADFISIHCPKTKDTINLFDAQRIARMRPTAYIVNTARGGIINEAALCAALSSGKIAGAGIDVFEREPAGADHPFCALPNVILAPHLAGVSQESVTRMATATIKNILSVLDGTPNRENTINPEVYGR